MGYEVLIGELRASATEHTKISTALGEHPVEITTTTPAPVGHVELAAWLGAVEEQLRNAHNALGPGQVGLASSLKASANDYQSVDDGTATALQNLLASLQLPGALPPTGSPGFPFDPLGNLGPAFPPPVLPGDQS